MTLPSPRHGRPLAGSCSNRHAVTWHPARLRPSGGAWVQALFHPPRRGPFHHSLTVLVRYRSAGVFSLGGWSPLLPAGFLVPRGTHGPTRSRRRVAYGTLTLSGRPFQQRSATAAVAHSVPGWPPRPGGPSNPRRASAGQPCPRARFGLLPFRSPLLRESSLFLGVLRCFTSPGAHPLPMRSAAGAWASPQAGCPIRTPPDLRLPAAPRGVSPLGRVLPRPQPPRHPPCALHVALASPHVGPAQGASALPCMPLQHALHIRHALPW